MIKILQALAQQHKITAETSLELDESQEYIVEVDGETIVVNACHREVSFYLGDDEEPTAFVADIYGDTAVWSEL